MNAQAGGMRSTETAGLGPEGVSTRSAKPMRQELDSVPRISSEESLSTRCEMPETGTAGTPSLYTHDLVKQIAMDIGKAVATHVEVMYPDAVAAASSTFLLSVRNCTHNEIMGALEHTDEASILAWIEDRKRFRRRWKATYRKIRKQPPAADAVEEL